MTGAELAIAIKAASLTLKGIKAAVEASKRDTPMAEAEDLHVDTVQLAKEVRDILKALEENTDCLVEKDNDGEATGS